MRMVLVDTAAWIALVNTRDELHSRAEQTMLSCARITANLVTSEFVLIEVANSLCTVSWRDKAIKLIDGLRALPNLRIIPADTSLLSEGWVLYSSRLDKEWSLTDCISLAIMQKQQIDAAFTSDHHFEQAGFVKLL
jgi:uncharacterized protein